MEEHSHLFALLLAGGKGTRFWPLSREDHPKQLLKLFSDRTLVEETYDRIRSLVPNERILVATSLGLAPRLMALFPDIPRENFIIEPVARNTARASLSLPTSSCSATLTPLSRCFLRTILLPTLPGSWTS